MKKTEPKTKIVTLKDDPSLTDSFQDLIDRNWHWIGTIDNVGCKTWDEMWELYPEYQFGVFVDDVLTSVGNCAPVWDDIGLNQLPDEGWRWVMKSCIRKSKLPPIYTSAISATVDAKFKGQGLAKIILGRFKDIAIENGSKAMIAPVRPNFKHKYPLIPMEEYIKWRREDGSHFDQWLRIHEKIGGKIQRTSKNSLIAEWDIKQWEKFSGEKFYSSGKYLFSDSLSPTEINLENDTGVYKEDNVWVVHNLS